MIKSKLVPYDMNTIQLYISLYRLSSVLWNDQISTTFRQLMVFAKLMFDYSRKRVSDNRLSKFDLEMVSKSVVGLLQNQCCVDTATILLI